MKLEDNEISGILFQTAAPMFKAILKQKCDVYETDSRYSVRKFYDGERLEGFCVWHDEGDVRCLDEAHYVGKNKYVFLRMVKEMMRGSKRFKVVVQKVNRVMIDLYIRHGFVIVGENSVNYVLER